MITYKFCITKFNVLVKDQGTNWVVRDISWIYSGVNENGVYASVEGTMRLDFTPEQTPFIPVDQITHTQLTTWLLDKMGSSFLNHIKESIEGTIYRNATIVDETNAMITWLPLPNPAAILVDQEVLNAYLSG
jgi:penicillin V acylase-like amidase (Ntn superfamily)